MITTLKEKLVVGFKITATIISFVLLYAASIVAFALFFEVFFPPIASGLIAFLCSIFVLVALLQIAIHMWEFD